MKEAKKREDFDDFASFAEYEKKRAKDFPAYKKEQKRLKKQLKKAAKNFKDWDYSSLLFLLKPAIELYYNLHSRPNVVVYDTSSEMNEYDKLFGSLEKSKELIEELTTQVHWLGFEPTEEDIIKELFTIIGDNLTRWWE